MGEGISVINLLAHRKISQLGQVEPHLKINLVHCSLTKHFWSISGVTTTDPPKVLKVALPLEKSNALGA